MRVIVLAALLALGGCTGVQWSTETKIEEGAYQVVSAVDTAQSLAIANHPDRLQEIGWPTASFIGNHPNQLQTVAWGVGRGLLHGFVTDQFVACGASPNVIRIWQGVSFGYELNTVQKNHSIGIGYTGKFQ